MKRLIKQITGTILVAALVLNFTACKSTASDTTVSLTHYCFDTVITITIYSYAGDEDSEDIINECFGLCNHYEKLFSKTIKDSDVSKINSGKGKPIQVNQITTKLIKDSLKYSELTKGKFDVSVGGLTSLWDFTSGDKIVPTDSDIKQAVSHINYKNINVDNNTVTLSDPDTSIDLGAIAKGFVADKLKSYMVSEGVSSAIINLGGNILTIGGKSSSDDFSIGIQKPFEQENEANYAATIDVRDKSVVTSGLYQRYFKKDNKLYHHILDTKTGYPVDNNLYSVTIISTSSEVGDALSTSAFTLGLKEGLNLINKTQGSEAVFITSKNEIVLTKGLEMDDKNNITFKEMNQDD